MAEPLVSPSVKVRGRECYVEPSLRLENASPYVLHCLSCCSCSCATAIDQAPHRVLATVTVSRLVVPAQNRESQPQNRINALDKKICQRRTTALARSDGAPPFACSAFRARRMMDLAIWLFGRLDRAMFSTPSGTSHAFLMNRTITRRTLARSADPRFHSNPRAESEAAESVSVSALRLESESNHHSGSW